MLHESGINSEFLGPVFIVGLSRSGTQLLRELLNRNQSVCIPVRETNFIPRLLAQRSLPTDQATDKVVKIVEKSSFIDDLRKLGEAPDRQRVKELAETFSIEKFIEKLLRECLPLSKRFECDCIWGDKSPNNMLHMKSLKRTYPQARFIHIIRDPRERALSANRSWGAHPLVSASQWRNCMAKVIEQRPQLAEDYLEIKYEALIAEPKKTLKQVCQFIGIAFHEDMLSLAKPADEAPLRPGITGQTTNIISGNTNKYLAKFSPKTIRRIEELTTPLAAQFGYLPLTKEVDYKPLGILEVLCVVVSDRYSKLRYFIKRWGWRKGLLFAWQRFVSGMYRNV